MTRPDSRRGSSAAGGKQGGARRSDADWYAELDAGARSATGRRGVGPASARDRRRGLARYGKIGTALAVVLGAGATGFLLLYRGPSDCRVNPERKRAFEMVTAQQVAVSGETVKRRFAGEAFRCADLAEPAGVLVTVNEDTGDPIIWFVDGAGAHNVNLLAQAWTPALTPAPPLPGEALAPLTQ